MLALGLGAGGLYYWQNHVNVETNPVSYFQKDAWLILKYDDFKSARIAMTDSQSIYQAIPSFHSVIDALNTLEIDETESSKPTFISIARDLSNPSIVIITDQLKSTQSENWYAMETDGIELTAFANQDKYEPLTENQDLQFDDLSLSEQDHLYISALGIQRIITSSFSDDFSQILNSEFPESDWLKFDFEDNGLMQATAVAKVKGSEVVEQDVSNLFRYLPSNTSAALSIASPAANYALVLCDYGFEDSTELFLLIEETQDSTSALDSIAQLHFNDSWIQSADINMIGTLQLVSKNEKASQRFINDYKAFNRLSEASIFQSLGEKMSASSFNLFIQRPSKYANGLVLKDIENTNAITSMLFQTNSEFADTKSYSLLISHNQEAKDNLRRYWSMVLDKPADAGPWRFINHYTSEEEILIQDKLHQLYLINREGKILWKKQLDNRIVGDITMIDAFASGKNQMLFTTKKRLTILDRNGNHIDGFPIKLDHEPTASPSAIRYDKDSEIRVLINLGNNLLNFTVEGTPVKGWKKPKTGILNHPIELLQIGDKDYLIAFNDGDSILFYDRSGKQRKDPIGLKINVKESMTHMGSDMKSSSISTIDSYGNLVITNLEGDQTSVRVPRDSNMTIAINNVGSIKYTTISGERLASYDAEGKEVLGYLFPTALKTDYVWLDQKSGWLAVSNGSDLYVVNTETGPLERMPVSGDQRCMLIDTDKNGVKEILTHQPDGTLTCYQLTY